MEAVFINQFPENDVATPMQAVETCLTTHSKNELSGWLLQTYRLAVMGGLSEGGHPVSAEEVATLFDQLIALAGTVEALREGGSGAQLCDLGDFCNSSNSDDEEGHHV